MRNIVTDLVQPLVRRAAGYLGTSFAAYGYAVDLPAIELVLAAAAGVIVDLLLSRYDRSK